MEAVMPEGLPLNQCLQHAEDPFSLVAIPNQAESTHGDENIAHITVEIEPWTGQNFKICCHPHMNGETLRRTAAEHLGFSADHISMFNVSLSLEVGRAPYMLHPNLPIAIMNNCTLLEQGVREGSVLRVTPMNCADETKSQQDAEIQDQRQFLTHGPPAGPPSTSVPLMYSQPPATPSSIRTGRKNCKWSHKETWALLFGMERYGPGRWKKILVDQEFGQHLRARTYVHLKDKWGNLYRTFRTGRVPRGDTAMFLPKVREIYVKWSESF